MSKKLPPGWPRVAPSVFYDDASKAIDWLCKVFGFTIRIKIEGEDGTIAHSELEIGDGADGLVMVGTATRARGRTTPRAAGGNTQSLMVFVDDVDAFTKRARELGAKVLMEPKTSDYGEDYWVDRTSELEDLEGHRWWFCQRLKTGKGEG